MAFSGTTLVPEFSRHTYSYTATVPNSVLDTDATLTDNADSEQAIVYRVGTGQGVELGAENIPLTEDGRTTIRVEVTSTDEKNTQTYTVVIRRLGGGDPTDTSLASLTLTDSTSDTDAADRKPITLNPPFDPGHRDYTATVEFAIESSIVAAVVNANDAVLVYIRNNVGQSSNGEVALGDDTVTTIKVRVTARDTTTIADYTIRVTRQARVIGTDATLSGIQTSPVLDIKPAPNKDVITYTANVAANVLAIETIIVTPTDVDTDGADDPDGAATVTVKKGTDTEAPFTLGEGDNVFTIEVTAEDGTTKKLYTLTVTREGTSGADDATLQALSLTDTTATNPDDHTPVAFVEGFSRMTYEYTAEVSFDTAQVTVAATPNITASDFVTVFNDANVGNNEVDLAVGDNEIVVRVTTTGSPSATKDYTITVNRLARVDSSDASLSNIELSGIPESGSPVDIDLSPDFIKTNHLYRASVDYDAAASVTVTATTTDTSGEATFEITPEDADADTTNGHQVELDEGVNDIEIEVTAEDGTTETYMVMLTRTPRSTDSTLSALSLKNGADEVLTEDFSSGRISYSANVVISVETLTLTATRSNADATVEVRVDGSLPLTASDDEYAVVGLGTGSGSFVITVKVTAKNPANITTYTITLTKP